MPRTSRSQGPDPSLQLDGFEPEVREFIYFAEGGDVVRARACVGGGDARWPSGRSGSLAPPSIQPERAPYLRATAVDRRSDSTPRKGGPTCSSTDARTRVSPSSPESSISCQTRPPTAHVGAYAPRAPRAVRRFGTEPAGCRRGRPSTAVTERARRPLRQQSGQGGSGEEVHQRGGRCRVVHAMGFATRRLELLRWLRSPRCKWSTAFDIRALGRMQDYLPVPAQLRSHRGKIRVQRRPNARCCRGGASCSPRGLLLT